MYDELKLSKTKENCQYYIKGLLTVVDVEKQPLQTTIAHFSKHKPRRKYDNQKGKFSRCKVEIYHDRYWSLLQNKSRESMAGFGQKPL